VSGNIVIVIVIVIKDLGFKAEKLNDLNLILGVV
jgi:hypothetical protein